MGHEIFSRLGKEILPSNKRFWSQLYAMFCTMIEEEFGGGKIQWLPTALYRLGLKGASNLGNDLLLSSMQIEDTDRFYFIWVRSCDSRTLELLHSGLVKAIGPVSEDANKLDLTKGFDIQLLRYPPFNSYFAPHAVGMLRPGRFIGDSILEVALDLLMDQYLLSEDRQLMLKRHLVAPMGMARKIFGQLVSEAGSDAPDSPTIARMPLRKLTRHVPLDFLVDSACLGFVVNFDNIHYAVITVDPSRKQVYYHDSLLVNGRPSDSYPWRAATRMALQYCQGAAVYCLEYKYPFNSQYLDATKWPSWIRTGEPLLVNVEQQGFGSNDCGAFCFKFALDLVSCWHVFFASPFISLLSLISISVLCCYERVVSFPWLIS